MKNSFLTKSWVSQGLYAADYSAYWVTATVPFADFFFYQELVPNAANLVVVVVVRGDAL